MAATMSPMPNWRSTQTARSLGLRVHTIANLGAYPSLFWSCVPTYLYATLLSGQYDIPAIYAEVDAVYTTTVGVDAVRGAGRPEATFVVERIVEKAARETGRDSAEFRRRNFVTTFPHQTPVIMCYDAGDYGKALDKALELADYKGLGARKAASAAKGKLRGIGFSAYIEACGLAPSAAVGSLGLGGAQWESGRGARQSDGLGGSPDRFAQSRPGSRDDLRPTCLLASRHPDRQRLDRSRRHRQGAIRVGHLRLALRRGRHVGALKGARQGRGQGEEGRGHVLEAAEGDIEFKEGKFTVKGTDKSIDFASVALHAHLGHKFNTQELEPGLKEGAFWDPTNFVFPAGVHICEVEIDPETGVTTIDRWTAVDDFGKLINPMIVEGQIHGGVTHGIGQALMEAAHHDSDGQLLTASYMDYCMPRAEDVPSFKVDTIETPCPSNPLGVKGCGEAGAIASPAAVINAITDALGHEDIAMPATPQAVWRAAQKSKHVQKRAAE